MIPRKFWSLRKKWKAECEANLRSITQYGNRGEAIIRDVKRMDSYPDVDDHTRRISPWFKVELKGLYHRGVEVFLRVERLRFYAETNEWKYAKSDDPESIKAFLVARIPFEIIKTVEWDGDEYYPVPHIYCEFARKGQPYEALVFCEPHDGVDHPFFIEVAKYEDIKK